MVGTSEQFLVEEVLSRVFRPWFGCETTVDQRFSWPYVTEFQSERQPDLKLLSQEAVYDI